MVYRKHIKCFFNFPMFIIMRSNLLAWNQSIIDKMLIKFFNASQCIYLFWVYASMQYTNEHLSQCVFVLVVQSVKFSFAKLSIKVYMQIDWRKLCVELFKLKYKISIKVNSSIL